MSVPAYLLVPDDGGTRGRPCCHPWSRPGQVDRLWTRDNGGPERRLRPPVGPAGYVVLAPDLRCFGERADWTPEDHYLCDTNLVHTVMAGWNPLAQNLFDLGRCLDVLGEHPLVDPSRIGVCGLSYGATCTLFLAALDDRVAAAVVSGFFSSWAEAHKMPYNMCGSQVMAGMLGQIEHVDLGALICPRPLLIETGTDDFLFPEAAAGQSAAVWTALCGRGADSALVHDVFEGDHQWHGKLAYPFLTTGSDEPAVAPKR